MQRKPVYAQKALEGLALEDFDKIRTSSDGLIECVKSASWRINETHKCLPFSDEFLRTVGNLRKAAKDKKVDAAGLAYVDMTLTWVKCHRHLRDQGSPAPEPVPARPRRGCDEVTGRLGVTRWPRCPAVDSIPQNGESGPAEDLVLGDLLAVERVSTAVEHNFAFGQLDPPLPEPAPVFQPDDGAHSSDAGGHADVVGEWRTG
jgi:hypothetical protein